MDGANLAPRITASRHEWPRVAWRLALFVASFFLLFLLLVAAGGLFLEVPATEAEAVPSWLAAPLALAALGASWFLAERVEGVPLAALGLPLGPGSLRSFAGGVAVGGVLMGATVGALALAGWVRWTPAAGGPGAWLATAMPATVFLVAAAFAEELLFRGYPLQALAGRAGWPVALAVTSVAFGLVHARNPSAQPLALLNVAVAGLVLGVALWRTFSLWFATGLHFAWNWTMGVGADLPVSGLSFGMPAYDAVPAGPPAWTGGGFGPEGGLAVTLAGLAGAAWLWRSGRLARSLPVLALGPIAEDRRRDGGAP